MENVEGFRQLVHSIGVTVETDMPSEEITFLFQMYGKKDLYGGGTNLITKVSGDGMERRIYLSDYTWTGDDDIPGQIKFLFPTPGRIGKASVRFYLQDGYEAAVMEQEAPVNTECYAYKSYQLFQKTFAQKEKRSLFCNTKNPRSILSE